MIYTYSHPHTSFKLIDTAPIEARLLLIHSLVMRLVDMGLTKRVLPLAHKTRRLARVLARASAHNHHMERKLAMLFSPLWRERVLRDLGGMAKLKLWDAAMLRARGVLPAVRANTIPKPEPVWWRSPERMAESERLKARFRLCMDAAIKNREGKPRIFRDPYKMDFEGQFRLAPIPRSVPRSDAEGSRLPRIYSKVDICEYNYNEIPVRKPENFGPAMVWPLEFYAAMTLEIEGDTRGLNAVVVMMREVRHPLHMFPDEAQHAREPGSNAPNRTVLIDPGTASEALVREHIKNDAKNIPDFVPEFLPLPIFLGAEVHYALFDKPP